jgi:alkylation response protein AidB-like acyl-CoA dehydrogenase
MAALGWMGLALPEEYGGAGLSLLDLAVLFEEFGRAATPGPMFTTTAMGALPVLEHGTDQQKSALLPGAASGEFILTAAIAEPSVNDDPRFVGTQSYPQGDRLEITGTKLFVPFAHVASHLLVAARTGGAPGDEDGLTLFVVETGAPGMSMLPLSSIGADRQFEVTFEGVSVSSASILGTPHDALPLIAALLMKAAALQCAIMIGGAQMELELTAEYTKTRVQFERPLGAFQAVQHRLADMFIDVNGARWVTYQALWRLGEGLPADREVAIAKAFANIACQRVALSAQQLHGGVGVDMDHDLHHYFRQAKAMELSLGGTPFHLEALEAHIGL